MRGAAPLLPLLVLVLAPPAEAGPPAICWPLDIGDAPSLPWASRDLDAAAFAEVKGYDRGALVDDVLRLLDAEPSALVRMETLRRATIYANHGQRDPLGLRLLATLEARALDREATQAPPFERARAWFDAGYLAECYQQYGARVTRGYAWLLRARALGEAGPEVELACALARFQGEEHHAHLRAAVAGSAPGDRVRRFLTRFLPHALKLAEPRDADRP